MNMPLHGFTAAIWDAIHVDPNVPPPTTVYIRRADGDMVALTIVDNQSLPAAMHAFDHGVIPITQPLPEYAARMGQLLVQPLQPVAVVFVTRAEVVFLDTGHNQSLNLMWVWDMVSGQKWLWETGDARSPRDMATVDDRVIQGIEWIHPLITGVPA